jgi:Na+/proline symporter
MTLVLILATVGIVLISIAIGFLVKRHLADFESYTSFRSRVGILGITASMVGNVIGGGVFFAVSSMGYDAGIAPLSILLSYMIGFALLAWLAASIRSIVQRHDVNDMYEVLRMRLGAGVSSDKYIFLLCVMTLCVYFFSLAGQFLVLSTFLKFFLPESTASVIVLSMVMMAILTFVYAAWGGLPKDIFTDMFQTCVILIAVMGGIITLFLHPPSMNTSQLPPDTFNGLGYGVVFPIAVILFFSPTYLARFDIWQRLIASKSTKVFRASLLISIPFICASYGLFVFLGIYARANGPGDSIRDTAVLWSIKDIMPAPVFLLMILGLYAAVMSTADTLLNVSTISSWKLITMIRPSYAVKMKDIRSIRKISVLVGILACMLIASAPDIVELMMGAFSSIVIFSPSILYVLCSKQPSARVSFISAAPSYMVFWGLYLAMPKLRLYAFIPCAVISIVVLVIGMLVVRVSRWRGKGANL